MLELLLLTAGLQGDSIYAGQQNIDEVVVVAQGRGGKRAAKGHAASIDEHLKELDHVELVRRGSYAWEPVVNNMQTERLSITIDGMKIFYACTDKMDPVTSYVESSNLQRISLNSGLNGNPQATGNIGGALDLKLRKAGFHDDGLLAATATAGYESNGHVQVYGADGAYASSRYYANGGAFYRHADNYKAGDHREISFSQFRKVNAFVNSGYRLAPADAIEATFIYDCANDVGYPALNMDVAKAEAFISSLAYKHLFETSTLESWETKAYYNHITHVMDDTKRPDVLIHMDMPGESWTAGAYSLLTATRGPHSAQLNIDGYYNRLFADMTMYPGGAAPMYMVTWPDVGTMNMGAALSGNVNLSTTSSLNFSGKLSWQQQRLNSDEGYRSLAIFFPGMRQQYYQTTGRVAAKYILHLSGPMHHPTKSPRQSVNSAAPTTIPRESVNSAAPIKSPCQSVKSAAPTKSPCQSVNSAAPTKSPCQSVNSDAPIKSPCQSVKSAAPTKSPRESVKSAAPIKSPCQSVKSAAPTTSPRESVKSAAPAADCQFSLGAGWGSRAPTVTEAYGYYLYNTSEHYDYIGNPTLKNESALELNANFKIAVPNSTRSDHDPNPIARFELDAAAFFFTNYIIGQFEKRLSAMTVGAEGVKVYANIPTAQLVNVALSAECYPVKGLRCSAKGTYSRGYDDHGHSLPLVAPLSYRSQVDYTVGPLSLQARLTGNARQTNYGSKYGETETPAWAVVGLSATYRLSAKLSRLLDGECTVRLGVENIFAHPTRPFEHAPRSTRHQRPHSPHATVGGNFSIIIKRDEELYSPSRLSTMYRMNVNKMNKMNAKKARIFAQNAGYMFRLPYCKARQHIPPRGENSYHNNDARRKLHNSLHDHHHQLL